MSCRHLRSLFRTAASVLLLLQLPGCLPASERAASEVPVPAAAAVEAAAEVAAEVGRVSFTYLANEGFLLAAGDTKVLIDGLFRPAVRGYPVLPAGERERVETGAGEFAGIDLLLASHYHGDHFSAAAVARYLAAEPAARFVSTPQAVEQLPAALRGERVEAVLPAVPGALPGEGAGERVERTFPLAGGGEIGLTVFNLDHGPGTDAENLGLLVEIAAAGGGTVRVLHVGDTEIAPAELAKLGLAGEEIDVALLPYWLLLHGNAEEWLAAVGAQRVVAIHLPAADAPKPWFEPAGSLAELRGMLAERWPEVVLTPSEPGLVTTVPAVERAAAGQARSAGEAPAAEEDPTASTVRFLEEELAADPENGSALLVLAMVHAGAGRRGAALAALARLPEIGWDFPLDDVDFAPLADDPAYRRIADRLAAASPRRPRPERLHTVADRQLVPEGTAYDPATGDLFLSSITRRKVVRIAADGTVEDFVAPAQDGLLGVLGMEVDVARRRLWVASAAVPTPAIDGLTPELAGRSTVHVFDLTSRRTVHRFEIGGPDEPSVLNDLTVLPAAAPGEGGAIVTDSQRGTVYRAVVRSDGGTGELVPLLPPGAFSFPNGIAVDGAGRLLYVTHFSGVSVVDLATLAIEPLTTPADPPAGMANLAGIDGLAWHRGELFALQNLLGMPRIWRLSLDGTGKAVGEAALLMSALPGDGLHDGPTTGAVVTGDGEPARYVYVANPQGRRFVREGDDAGAMLPVEQLAPLAVVAVPLVPPAPLVPPDEPGR